MDAQTIIRSAKPVDWSDKDALVSKLSFSYQIIKASERLLTEAISELPDCRLRSYYAEHLEEEKNHADWLLEDLGFTPAYSPLAAAIAGSQYYLIKHEHPAALLGYMAVLEGNGPTLDFINAMEVIHGRKIMRTWRHHVMADIEHHKDIQEEIKAHPEHAKLIEMNAIQTAYYLVSHNG